MAANSFLNFTPNLTNNPTEANSNLRSNQNTQNLPQTRMNTSNLNNNQQPIYQEQYLQNQMKTINTNYQKELNMSPATNIRPPLPQNFTVNQNPSGIQKNTDHMQQNQKEYFTQPRFPNQQQIRPPINNSINLSEPSRAQSADQQKFNSTTVLGTSKSQHILNTPTVPQFHPTNPDNLKTNTLMSSPPSTIQSQLPKNSPQPTETHLNTALNSMPKINKSELKPDMREKIGGNLDPPKDENNRKILPSNIQKNEIPKTEVQQAPTQNSNLKVTSPLEHQGQPVQQVINDRKSEKKQEKNSSNTEEIKQEKNSSNTEEKKQEKNSNSAEEKKQEKNNNGIVRKNIQFFEEKDTAKKPLIPKISESKKDSGGTSSVKKSFNKTHNESGVDETPMVFPNLRSIYQKPIKVAKIPKIRHGKLKSKFWNRTNLEKRVHGYLEKNVRKKSGFLNSYEFSHKKNFNKEQKSKIFGPDEELLAFFYKSKSMRKIKGDDSHKRDQSASRSKIASRSTTNGDIVSPKKTPSKLPAPSKRSSSLSSPTKTPIKSPSTPGPRTPKTPETPTAPLIKKVPMNKIQVGAAPSPNLKAVKSKVGSLANTTHKPGGGNIKIESHKVDFSKAQPRIAAKNDQYTPSGGDKKIQQVKLQWSAKSKVGSLENATYKPGGGDKKIESVKLDFKEKAKPKVGSKENVKHVPGGGTVKIENQKLEFKGQSKVGSLDNIKHKPGGGEIKIFDDKTYLKQVSGSGSEGRLSGTQSFGELSVVRGVEGRSLPGTPGHKTTIQIKKTTIINNNDSTPTLKNITEVNVASLIPKNQVNSEKLPAKKQVTLTYSKLSSPSHSQENKDYVEVVKVPVKDHAPILKPSLRNMDALNESVKTFEDNYKITKPREAFESSSLSDDKLASDSKISQLSQEKILPNYRDNEIWQDSTNLKETAKNQPHSKLNLNENNGDTKGERIVQAKLHYFPDSQNRMNPITQHLNNNSNITDTSNPYLSKNEASSPHKQNNYQGQYMQNQGQTQQNTFQMRAHNTTIQPQENIQTGANQSSHIQQHFKN